MNEAVSIVWFRQDLRLSDNPALAAAAKRGAVVPVFIWAPEEEGDWPPGAASRWWLHQSLAALDESLRECGSRLILRRGPSLSVLRVLARQTSATAIFWNRRYEPAAIARDSRVHKALHDEGLEAQGFNGSLLFESWEVKTGSGGPYQVFTPFWRACLKMPEPRAALPAPSKLRTPQNWPKSAPLASLALEPAMDWAGGMRAAWRPGERGVRRQLKRFVATALADYSSGRDCPAVAGTSRLSPHLHFGEIGPRQVWRAVRDALEEHNGAKWRAAAEVYLREIGWREFSHHLLFHFPQTPARPLRKQFERFEWARDAVALRAWQRGQTGYPIVDAGMRELWTTGWMHNRVRMIVASFLTKDLLLPWQQGARWFWDTLVDADLANNTLGWQWSAGCGADAAPFFRIFNPVSQSQKFDANGAYIRRWIPELAQLPAKWIHVPCEAPAEALKAAGVVLGKTYPKPLVDHAQARSRALQAFAGIREWTKPA